MDKNSECANSETGKQDWCKPAATLLYGRETEGGKFSMASESTRVTTNPPWGPS